MTQRGSSVVNGCDRDPCQGRSPQALGHRRQSAARSLTLLPLWTACVLVLLGGRFGEAATLTLAWDPPSDGIITGYVIRYGTQSRTYTDQINVGVTTTFSVDDLTPGIRYYFTIQARGPAGSLSEPSNEASAVAPGAGGTRPPQRPPGPTLPPFETSPPPNEAFGVRARLDGKLPDIPPPDPSTSTNIAALAASVRDHRFIDLRWTAEVGTDLFGYRISAGSAPGREDVGTFTTGPTAQFTIGDLPAGNYYVRVQALEVSGTGVSSPEVFVKFDPGGPALDATRSLEAKVGGNTVALSWLPPETVSPSTAT